MLSFQSTFTFVNENGQEYIVDTQIMNNNKFFKNYINSRFVKNKDQFNVGSILMIINTC